MPNMTTQGLAHHVCYPLVRILLPRHTLLHSMLLCLVTLQSASFLNMITAEPLLGKDPVVGACQLQTGKDSRQQLLARNPNLTLKPQWNIQLRINIFAHILKTCC